MKGHIKSGIWDPNINRMVFLVRSTISSGFDAGGSNNMNVGTYIKPLNNLSPGAEGTNPQNGHHYYHGYTTPVTANKWMKVYVTNRNQHERGDPGSADGQVIPNYFDTMTRFYITHWGSYLGNPASTWDLGPIYLYKVLNEPDDDISSETIQYNGTKYQVTWAGRKNVDVVYEIRYRLDGVSLKSAGFLSGISGGTKTNPGNDYTGVYWDLTAPESTQGIYIGIRVQGASQFTELFLPYQVSPANMGLESSTPDTTPPTSPTSLAANATSQSSITVSWNASTDNVGVTGYQVERCTGLSCTTFANVGNPTASPFVDSGLTASTGYSYHVRALDAAGNMSGWSNVVGATTQAPDTTPPSTPTSLSATATSSSTIDLTWTASTDNPPTGGGVTGYKVERCSGASCTTFTQVGTPTTNSYQDTGLSASTTYRYQVRATDAANNNSSYSSIAQASTPVAPPTPTFVAEYETAWNSATSPKTTSNFSVQSGDILVAYAVNESSGSTIATPPTGTLAGTWTLKQTISATNYTYLRLWTMQVASNQTNVNVTFTNGGGNFGADVLHFRNASSVGITAQANSATGNPTLTLNGISDNSTIVMVNGDWSAKTGARTYNTANAGTFTETSAYADGSTYGVEAGYYGNAGTAGNKTIGITAPTGMTWALAAIEVKGNPTAQPQSCNTVTTTNFSQSAYNSYGAPFDAFQTGTNLLDAKCNSADTHTINLTTGVTGDTTRIIYTKGYYYDPVTAGWTQYSGTCTGALNGEWCQGSVSATITNPNISTASASNPTYLVGMTCSVQGGSWKCG